MSSLGKRRQAGCRCDSPACNLEHEPRPKEMQTKRKSIDPIGPNSWKRYRDVRREGIDNDSSESDDDDEEDNGPERSGPYGYPQYDVKTMMPSYRDVKREIDELMKDFCLTAETYKNLTRLLEDEMLKGLGKKTHYSSTVRMFPTYVRCIPDGSEEGRFLALDLGGTNFRVLLVDLRGRDSPKMISKIFLIPKAIMLGPGQQLFDHIAKCMARFLDQEGLRSTSLPLGFTFSFPCYQDGLASARLVRWTKGFKCDGVVGEDVVKLLHEAVGRRNLKVKCKAVINDPVGALMACAHTDKNCRVGLILGTGTNACYMEDLDNVELWDEDTEEPKQVIVNTEWGAFGDSGILEFIRNEFDREVDNHSLNPGHQLFEKMISGMYMGEIVRLVLTKLTREGLLFDGRGSEDLFTRQRFLTKYISEIESDDPDNGFYNTKLILQELDINHYTYDDCRHVQHVCFNVSQRAAFLAAAAVATVLNRLKKPETTVAVDGSLYRFHPYFHDLMVQKISELINPGIKFKLALAHDGSGKGAALVAAVAERMLQRREKLSNHTQKSDSFTGKEDTQNNNPTSVNNNPTTEFTGQQETPDNRTNSTLSHQTSNTKSTSFPTTLKHIIPPRDSMVNNKVK